MCVCECSALLGIHHRAVVIDHLAQGAGRVQSGEGGEVDSRLGMARPLEDPAGDGAQRHHVPRSGEVRCLRFGVAQSPDGDRPVGSGDAGGDDIARIHGDGVRGALAILVDHRHRGQVETIEIVSGHAHADVAARVPDHECSQVGRGLLCGEDEVAFVFTALVIDHDHGAPIGDGLDGLVDGIHAHGIVLGHWSPRG